MKRHHLARILAVFAILLSTFRASAAPAPNLAFADPAFAQLWQQYDAPVANGSVKHGYVWGPQPNSGPLLEDYAEVAGGKRLVQYFDKGRMEINHPDSDKSSPYYVTSGLLTRELITGQMQVGDNKFVPRWPAEIPIAGQDGLTYADFRRAIQYPDADKTDKTNNTGYPRYVTRAMGGDAIDVQVDRAPCCEDEAVYTPYKVQYAYYEQQTQHNIADVFWNYLNQVSGEQPYFYLTGYPLSDPFWSASRFESGSDILYQVFERRVLTYLPDGPTGYKVQMANVGQAYYDWRYNNAGKPTPYRPLTEVCSQDQQSVLKYGFRKLWQENIGVQQIVDCPDSSFLNTLIDTVSAQFYEHGLVVTFTDKQEYEGIEPPEDIFMMSSDGEVNYYDSAYPYRLSGPMTNTVPAKLGSAITGVKTLKVTDENNDRIIRQFYNGLMINPDPSLKRIYVLYSSTGSARRYRGHYIDMIIDRWQVFDDTYTGP